MTHYNILTLTQTMSDLVITKDIPADLSGLEAEDNIADDLSDPGSMDMPPEIDTGPPIPQPPIMSEEDIRARRLLLAEMARGKILYPDTYAQVVVEDIQMMSLEQLRVLHADFDLAINLRSNSATFKFLAQQGIGMIESLGPKMGKDWTGLTICVNNSQPLQEVIKELEWKYGTSKYVPPEAKLAIGLFGLCNALDAHNKEIAMAKRSTPADKKVEEQFKDI